MKSLKGEAEKKFVREKCIESARRNVSSTLELQVWAETVTSECCFCDVLRAKQHRTIVARHPLGCIVLSHAADGLR